MIYQIAFLSRFLFFPSGLGKVLVHLCFILPQLSCTRGVQQPHFTSSIRCKSAFGSVTSRKMHGPFLCKLTNSCFCNFHKVFWAKGKWLQLFYVGFYDWWVSVASPTLQRLSQFSYRKRFFARMKYVCLALTFQAQAHLGLLSSTSITEESSVLPHQERRCLSQLLIMGTVIRGLSIESISHPSLSLGCSLNSDWISWGLD